MVICDQSCGWWKVSFNFLVLQNYAIAAREMIMHELGPKINLIRWSAARAQQQELSKFGRKEKLDLNFYQITIGTFNGEIKL